MSDRLIIFDTTMRDGEQSPGASMTREEKLRIGKQLERMRVDVIEAGFPAASNGDFESVRAVARSVKDSIVCGLARANDSDVRRAGDAVKPANAARIHTFIATSPVHMERKLRMSPEQVIEQAVKSVTLARSLCEDVEFSPEDAGRSEIDYLCRILEAVIDAGARTINIPDTVGYTMPEQFASMIRQLRERIPNSDKAVWSVHCHNDLGLAVANSLAAVMNGARQVECTVNGLGERAGNAPLEEVVMALRHLCNRETGIDTRQLPAVSRLVVAASGRAVADNKCVVGDGVFTHESGIHVDGLLKNPLNYQGFDPAEVGRAHRLVLGKHSGAHGVSAAYRALGIELSPLEAQQILARIRQHAVSEKRAPQDDELKRFHEEIGQWPVAC